MLVEEVMSTELVTCDVDASVRDAAERMLRNRVGSVIVTDGGSPAGIATEADALHAGYATDDPFSAIPLRKAMTSPVATIQPTMTLRTATDRMRSEGVKKLVVVEDMRPVGIVTTQDVVDNYAGIRREVRDLASDAANWSNRNDRLDD
ncbi:CBS domain-containing protein [Halorubrum trueperi]|uniref:CBS domain-containing protein n=1 Tax=Halorubrum trueperi TaxID=2004704 RepID=A0ABD5UQE1_9EURY